jgi:dCMP deaminase
MKNKFVNAHMIVADTYANLSSANRLKVGCVIVKNDTIIGIGYNGMPSGWDNTCEDIFVVEENGQRVQKTKTKPEVIHAEINALSKVARSTNSSEGSVMFITHAPCMECSKALFQAGIQKVFYKNQYRDLSGIEFLQKCNVEVEQINA